MGERPIGTRFSEFEAVVPILAAKSAARMGHPVVDYRISTMRMIPMFVFDFAPTVF